MDSDKETHKAMESARRKQNHAKPTEHTAHCVGPVRVHGLHYARLAARGGSGLLRKPRGSRG